MNTTTKPSALRQLATKEMALFTGLLFLGLVIMPILIFLVGQSVFGTYGGVGYADFFASLGDKVRGGDIVAWFLILSPYLGWQCLRLMVFGWRIAGR